MLSGVLVKVGVYGIIRMETLLFPDASVLLLLVPVGAAAALFGAFAALANPDLKRLLAYSTISNMGFIVLALGWGGQLGMIAALVNLVNHALIKAGLFLTGGLIVERLGEHELRRLGGLAGLTPSAAVAFGVGAIALAGLPPTSGLFSKLMLLEAGVDRSGALVLGAVLLASALGIAYPARAFVRVFWGESSEAVRERWRAGGFGAWVVAAPLLLAAGSLLLGLWPAPLLGLARATAAELSDPAIYIGAVLNQP
jgi:multicomponent Na+:H+ antiporter subunit D